jgi:hypothetical protein
MKLRKGKTFAAWFSIESNDVYFSSFSPLIHSPQGQPMKTVGTQSRTNEELIVWLQAG